MSAIPTGLVAELGSELVWLVVATGFGFVIGTVLAVLALQGRKVASAALPAGVALVAAAVPILGAVATSGWSGLEPLELRVATTTFGALPIVGFFTLGPVVATTWGVLALAGARHAPRRRLHALVGAALVLATAGLAVSGGFAGINWVYGTLRGGLYVGMGALVVVGLLGGGEDGPEAGAGAAMGFPLWVAVGEASERGLAHLILLQQTSAVTADRWDAGVAWMLKRVGVELPWSYAALAAASGVAVVGVALAWRHGRGPAAAIGLVWTVLAWWVLWSADLGAERLGALGVLCGS